MPRTRAMLARSAISGESWWFRSARMAARTFPWVWIRVARPPPDCFGARGNRSKRVAPGSPGGRVASPGRRATRVAPITNCPKKGSTLRSFSIGAYLLSGSQAVDITELVPLTSHATPTTVLTGGSVTFTATVDGHVGVASLGWYWVPGESAGSPEQDGNPYGPLSGGQYIGCWGQLSCTYKPAKSGRVYVEWEDRWALRALGE